jgi:hypothetical protein
VKILVKFPTRSRPAKFLKVLSDYVSKAANNDNIIYLVSIDLNDATMTKEVIEKAYSLHKNVVVIQGISRNKIEACNRDIHLVKGWDVLVLASDDMICQEQGWDEQIRKDMQRNFADLDGVLYYPDGYTQLNTMCIMGRAYYNRFNYIYHPSYNSLFCDNEFQEVSRLLGKEYKSDLTLFKHEHPVWSGEQYDPLMTRNESFYQVDKRVYEQRKRNDYK